MPINFVFVFHVSRGVVLRFGSVVGQLLLVILLFASGMFVSCSGELLQSAKIIRSLCTIL